MAQPVDRSLNFNVIKNQLVKGAAIKAVGLAVLGYSRYWGIFLNALGSSVISRSAGFVSACYLKKYIPNQLFQGDSIHLGTASRYGLAIIASLGTFYLIYGQSLIMSSYLLYKQIATSAAIEAL